MFHLIAFMIDSGSAFLNYLTAIPTEQFKGKFNFNGKFLMQ